MRITDHSIFKIWICFGMLLSLTTCTEEPLSINDVQQEYPAEHNHLLNVVRSFDGEARLGFRQVATSLDNNVLYLAWNAADIDPVEYYEVIVPGGGATGEPPSGSPTSYEVGKMTLDGNKIWAKNFPFSPAGFAEVNWPEWQAESVIVVGGRGSNKEVHIAILSASGEELFMASEVLDALGDVLFIHVDDVVVVQETKKVVLAGSVFYDGSNIRPFVVQLSVDLETESMQVDKFTDVSNYEGFICSIKKLEGNPTAAYLLSTDVWGDQSALVFLDENLEITKEVDLSFDLYWGYYYGELVQIDEERDQILVASNFNDSTSTSFHLVSLDLTGEEQWRTYSNLSEYQDQAYSLIPFGDYIYVLGKHSYYGHVLKEGEEVIDKKYLGNATIVKYDRMSGTLLGYYTFSRETSPWNVTEFIYGLPVNGNFYLWGNYNLQLESVNISSQDAWMGYVPLSEL